MGPPYSSDIVANTQLLADRVREIVQQEADRAKNLDTKAGAIIAAAVALTGAVGAFVIQLAKLEHAGQGAQTLWAIEVGATLLALLVAGGLAAWAIAPAAVRSQIHYSELKNGPPPRSSKRVPP